MMRTVARCSLWIQGSRWLALRRRALSVTHSEMIAMTTITTDIVAITVAADIIVVEAIAAVTIHENTLWRKEQSVKISLWSAETS